MKKFLFLSLISLFVFVLPLITEAQCALCQAQVQTNTQEGNHQAAGLNSGILYLMFTPYIIAIGLGWIWYRKFRKKDILLQMKKEPLHLN
jgi:nucleoside recognition membrane protein YjiH